MPNYTEHMNNAVAFNEYLVKATVEYWTAVSFPAIFWAKYL